MKETFHEELLADVLVLLSVVAVVMASVGMFGVDIILASTQWMLIAGILMLYAIYIQLKK